jgi:hypothetical protein
MRSMTVGGSGGGRPPFGVVGARPVCSDGAEGDAAEGVAGGWVEEREVEVAGDDHERDVHEGVVRKT